MYGIPHTDRKRLKEDQRPIDDFIDKTTTDLDSYLEVNGMKSNFIGFNEFKSTAISEVMVHALTSKSHLNKQVATTLTSMLTASRQRSSSILFCCTYETAQLINLDVQEVFIKVVYFINDFLRAFDLWRGCVREFIRTWSRSNLCRLDSWL